MGEWQGGLPHGAGTYLGKDRYEGNFLNGLKFGFGEENFSNGDKYIGILLFIQDSTSIALRMGMGNIFGLTKVCTKGISSRESDMAMESGRTKTKFIRGTIGLTRRRDSEFTPGKGSKSTKDNFVMILDKDTANSFLL